LYQVEILRRSVKLRASPQSGRYCWCCCGSSFVMSSHQKRTHYFKSSIVPNVKFMYSSCNRHTRHMSNVRCMSNEGECTCAAHVLYTSYIYIYICCQYSHYVTRVYVLCCSANTAVEYGLGRLNLVSGDAECRASLTSLRSTTMFTNTNSQNSVRLVGEWALWEYFALYRSLQRNIRGKKSEIII